MNRTMKAGSELRFTLDIAEDPFRIGCDVHPWMGAWCFVGRHPLAVVTGETGQFRIGEVDAGTYEVDAWHEELGRRSAVVIVGAEEDGSVEFVFRKP